MIQPHQQRVIAEQAELDEKIAKLAPFIDSNPLFSKLPADEQDRMKRQLDYMKCYSEVLGERIENFEG